MTFRRIEGRKEIFITWTRPTTEGSHHIAPEDFAVMISGGCPYFAGNSIGRKFASCSPTRTLHLSAISTKDLHKRQSPHRGPYPVKPREERKLMNFSFGTMANHNGNRLEAFFEDALRRNRYCIDKKLEDCPPPRVRNFAKEKAEERSAFRVVF
jgi:hypothetical protein